MGGSTTWGPNHSRDGYPVPAARLLDERFGDGRVEVINLGIPVSNSATTLVLARRFLTESVRPDIVVLYQGFNDLFYWRSRALAERSLDAGGMPSATLFRAPAHQGSLLQLLFSEEPHPFDDSSFREKALRAPLLAHRDMLDLARERGFTLYLSTFASPSYGELPEEELDFFRTELHFLWPMLGSVESYQRDLAAYNAAVVENARRIGVPLIDVAAAHGGGREVFIDNCHRTEQGVATHGRIAFDALASQIAEILQAENTQRPSRIP